MNTESSAGSSFAMEGVSLDRLLKQRSALRKLGVPFDLPPQRGEFRSLSGGAVCIAAEIPNSFRTLIQNRQTSSEAIP
jgi:hypothetical protein